MRDGGAVAERPECVEGRGRAHRMQFETPDGPTVRGVCAYCGNEQVVRVDPVGALTYQDLLRRWSVGDREIAVGGDYYLARGMEALGR